jgi:hypothetical protein
MGDGWWLCRDASNKSKDNCLAPILYYNLILKTEVIRIFELHIRIKKKRKKESAAEMEGKQHYPCVASWLVDND